MTVGKQPRRQIAHVSTLGTTQLHLKNPLVVAWWSCAFPGFGHLLLNKYLRALSLFLWEFIINTFAHLNEAIVYTITGQFAMATEVLQIRWLALYVAVYLFAIFDSYRTSIDMNYLYILADRENAPFISFRMNAIETNYLDKRNPLTSIMWSLLMPGMGHLYIHRVLTAIFILGAWILIMYESKFLISLHYTIIGSWYQVSGVLDKQWFLYIPSIYIFSVYDSYMNTVEQNKLFAREINHFLTEQYQSKQFIMPIKL